MTFKRIAIGILAKVLALTAAATSLVVPAGAQYSGSGPQPVSRGGTGLPSLPAGRLLLGNGTDPIGFIAPGTAGRCLVDSGTNWLPGFCVTSPAAAATGSSGHAVPFLDGVNAWSGVQTLNLNPGGLPSPLTGAALNVAQADGIVSRIQLNSFGAISAFTGAVYGGTRSSPAAVGSGVEIATLNSYAFNGSTLVGPIAAFRSYTAEAISSGHQGSRGCIATTALNSTSLVDSACQSPNGNFYVGTLIGGDTAPLGVGTAAIIGNSSGGGLSSGIQTRGSGGAAIGLFASTGVADGKIWDIATFNSGASFQIRALSDVPPPGTTATAAISVSRGAGIAISNVAIPNSPLVLGTNGSTLGSLIVNGSATGAATINAQAAAGTPALLWPTSSGTLVASASSPLVRDPVTGNLTCPTCVTSSGGGGITGAAPINVSGAGIVSLSFGATLANIGGQLQTVAMSGDLTTPANSFVATLATVNSNVGACGSSTSIPTITLNGKGLATTCAGNAVIAPAGTLTGATLAAGVITSSLTSVGTLTGGSTGAGFTIALGTSTVSGILPAASHPALTGDVTTPSGSVATTLATINSNVGTFGAASTVPVITADAKGRLTAVTTAAVVAPAGTLSGATLAAGVTASSLTSFGTSPTLSSPALNGTVTGTGVAAANTVSTLVQRDSSGNFAAGTVTASLTGHASLDLALTGGTLTGPLLFSADNTIDIGASAATRPRTGYYGTSVVSPLAVGGSAAGSSLSLQSTTGAGAGDFVRILVGSNGGTEALRAITNGSVGIGVTAPTAQLDVQNLASVNANALQFTTYASSVNVIGRRANGSPGSETAPTASQNLLAIQGKGWNSTGFTTGFSSAIIFQTAESWTPSANGTKIISIVTPVGSTSTLISSYLSASGGMTLGATEATTNASELAIAKSGAAPIAPSAGFLKLQVVAGTNAGTCKLIAYAGTSATPSTIVDNVGGGC